MYLRFVVRRQDVDSRSWTGLFTLAYDVLCDGSLDACLEPEVEGLIDWFNEHLDVPGWFSTRPTDRAICWFKADARLHVRQAWALAVILRESGEPVELLRTQEPGSILYEDEHQVVATPKKRDRIRLVG